MHKKWLSFDPFLRIWLLWNWFFPNWAFLHFSGSGNTSLFSLTECKRIKDGHFETKAKTSIFFHSKRKKGNYKKWTSFTRLRRFTSYNHKDLCRNRVCFNPLYESLEDVDCICIRWYHNLMVFFFTFMFWKLWYTLFILHIFYGFDIQQINIE